MVFLFPQGPGTVDPTTPVTRCRTNVLTERVEPSRVRIAEPGHRNLTVQVKIKIGC